MIIALDTDHIMETNDSANYLPEIEDTDYKWDHDIAPNRAELFLVSFILITHFKLP